jgi:hypothetical protein
MAVLTGYGGAVKISTATIAELGEWSADIDLDTEDTTAFLDSWHEFSGTLKGWSGSCSGRWDIN